MGDISQVREWLGAGLDPDYVADRVGTGLMIAAWTGNVPMMELFVTRGADVNKANALGEQALMHAAWRGKADAGDHDPIIVGPGYHDSIRNSPANR